MRLIGSEFQMVWSAYPNARAPYVASLLRGRPRWPRSAKRRCRRPGTPETCWGNDDRYPGVMLCRHLNTWTHSLNRTRSTTSSQCNSLRRNWRSPLSNSRGVFETILAAALRTRSSLSVVFFGAPIKRLPQQSLRFVTNAWTSVATESLSRERRMWRSCRNSKRT